MGEATRPAASPRRASAWAVGAVSVAALLMVTPTRAAAPHTPPVRCDIVAAPGGDDRGPGTLRRPVRSVSRLLAALPPRGVGCLRRGRYRENVKVSRDAITLRGFPGERAVVQGRLWIARSAVGVTVSDLGLDGRNARRLPSPTINGSGATFARNDVTNHRTGICFLVGSPGWGRARGTTLTRNRIHDCGRVPATNREHGVYISYADRTAVEDNAIYGNADRGIQLYPNATRTRITGNIVYGNGQGLILSGADGVTSSRTTVTGNVLAASRIRSDVESYYPEGTPPGTTNVVRGNCIFGGRTGTVDRGAGGFRAFDNVEKDPGFVAPRRGDFRLRANTPCAAIVASSVAPAGPRGEPPLSG